MKKLTKAQKKKLVDRAGGIVDEFYRNAKPSTLFEDVRKQIVEEENDPEKYQRREAEWAKKQAGIADLMHRVVGAEGDY